MAIESDIIKDLISEFKASNTLRCMVEGQRYYRGKNDILFRKLNEYTIFDQNTKTRVKKINENKSDEKIPHAFHKKMVNQKVNYICSKPITLTYNTPGVEKEKSEKVKINEKKIIDLVWNRLGYKFEKLIKNRAKEASNKGISWIHPDYKDNMLIFKPLSSQECIPIYDTETKKELVGFLHFYPIIDVINNEKRIYVEYWDDKEVRYYIETKTNDGNTMFLEDVSKESPGCHWTTEVYDTALNALVNIEKHSWGRVPFIPAENNEEHSTDLENIKPLIDAYDLINSNFVNTVEDLKEIIWLITGYGAEDLLALIENLKVNGVARTNDTNGKIDAKTIEIPYEARETLLKGLKALIYEFGNGVDTTNKDLLSQAPSGVSLNFLYSDLDLKADDMIGGLKTAIYEVLWYLLTDLKNKNIIPMEINEFDFNIKFNKSRIFNEIELMNALSSDTVLSTKTKLANHPKVEDPDIEYGLVKQEKLENIKMQQEHYLNVGFNANNNGEDSNE